ncbi:hypothetical protein HK101_011996 [Irineochytrium annulatum]|nr:hypothetical protein HK101_011996 [Irineochytrium annulatum]
MLFQARILMLSLFMLLGLLATTALGMPSPALGHAGVRNHTVNPVIQRYPATLTLPVIDMHHLLSLNVVIAAFTTFDIAIGRRLTRLAGLTVAACVPTAVDAVSASIPTTVTVTGNVTATIIDNEAAPSRSSGSAPSTPSYRLAVHNEASAPYMQVINDLWNSTVVTFEDVRRKALDVPQATATCDDKFSAMPHVTSPSYELHLHKTRDDPAKSRLRDVTINATVTATLIVSNIADSEYLLAALDSSRDLGTSYPGTSPDLYQEKREELHVIPFHPTTSHNLSRIVMTCDADASSDKRFNETAVNWLTTTAANPTSKTISDGITTKISPVAISALTLLGSSHPGKSRDLCPKRGGRFNNFSSLLRTSTFFVYTGSESLICLGVILLEAWLATMGTLFSWIWARISNFRGLTSICEDEAAALAATAAYQDFEPHYGQEQSCMGPMGGPAGENGRELPRLPGDYILTRTSMIHSLDTYVPTFCNKACEGACNCSYVSLVSTLLSAVESLAAICRTVVARQLMNLLLFKDYVRGGTPRELAEVASKIFIRMFKEAYSVVTAIIAGRASKVADQADAFRAIYDDSPPAATPIKCAYQLPDVFRPYVVGDAQPMAQNAASIAGRTGKTADQAGALNAIEDGASLATNPTAYAYHLPYFLKSSVVGDAQPVAQNAGALNAIDDGASLATNPIAYANHLPYFLKSSVVGDAQPSSVVGDAQPVAQNAGALNAIDDGASLATNPIAYANHLPDVLKPSVVEDAQPGAQNLASVAGLAGQVAAVVVPGRVASLRAKFEKLSGSPALPITPHASRRSRPAAIKLDEESALCCRQNAVDSTEKKVEVTPKFTFPDKPPLYPYTHYSAFSRYTPVTSRQAELQLRVVLGNEVFEREALEEKKEALEMRRLEEAAGLEGVVVVEEDEEERRWWKREKKWWWKKGSWKSDKASALTGGEKTKNHFEEPKSRNISQNVKESICDFEQMPTPAQSFYRLCLRSVRTFPCPAASRQPIARNVRQLIELYKDERDPKRVRDLAERGWRDLELVKRVWLEGLMELPADVGATQRTPRVVL